MTPHQPVRVVVSRAAKMDTENAAEWYRRHSPAAETRFLDAITHCFTTLGAVP